MNGLESKSETAFGIFEHHHVLINRFFHSTEISYRLTNMYVNPFENTRLVCSLFPKKWKRYDSLKQYLTRLEEGAAKKEKGNISDLKEDISDNWDTLYESVIIKEVSAFEKFVRDWALTAANMEISTQGRGLPEDRKSLLKKLIDDFSINSRINISIGKLADFFPTVTNILNSTPHTRTCHPLLSAPRFGISCLRAAQMWREVRNLILHNDRIVHQEFMRNWSKTWLDIAREARSSGHLIAIRPAQIGQKLPLVFRHVIFCLTTCYQAASLLRLATEGS